MATESATNREPAPTGAGPVVLESVNALIDQLMAVYIKHKSSGVFNPKELQTLKADLTTRAEFGKEKYGTYLRAHNGRRAIVDMYQEVSDAIMYCAQGRIEGDTRAGAYLELLINLGAQLAGEVKAREAVVASTPATA